MNKSAYQSLRWSVEADIRLLVRDESIVKQITDNVMRSVLAEVSTQEVNRQRHKREFLTFRRNPEATVPGWAFRKPGIDSRLPTL